MILAIECTHNACSVAVLKSGTVLCSKVIDLERGQAEVLLPMVQNVLNEMHISFNDLSCIAVCVGPGSFTGVRIGLACAQGLALASGLPTIGISTFEAVAFLANLDKCCVVLETKRNDFYVQHFDKLTPIHPPNVAESSMLKNLTNITFVGNGVARLIEEIGTVSYLDIPMPTAETIGLLAVTKTPSNEALVPLYLREAEVNLACKQKLL